MEHSYYRKHERIKSKTGIILTSDGIFCKLMNLSKEGLFFRCIDNLEIPNELYMDIHDMNITSIEELQVEKVWVKQLNNILVTPRSKSIFSFEVGGVFKNLSSTQRSQINSYLGRLIKMDNK